MMMLLLCCNTLHVLLNPDVRQNGAAVHRKPLGPLALQRGWHVVVCCVLGMHARVSWLYIRCLASGMYDKLKRSCTA